MAHNLPLLPDKDALCGDVRSVLQEVFRESSYLPPLDGASPEAGVPDVAAVQPDPWMKCVSLQSAKLNNCEEKLQREYAKRLAKDTLPNIYKLQSISVYENQSKWKEDLGLLERRDLKPTLLQDATRDESLWIKNTLHSSGTISPLKITGSKINAQATLRLGDEMSVQSISWGEVAPALPAPSLLSPSNTASPDYIICIPPQLQFINFKIGQLYTQSLRLINVSKFEMRLSIRPLKHRELDVQLCSRLVVTSGSAAELKIHFRPHDVRILCDKLLVRVSSGQTLYIPIECYMVPPVLDIIVSTIKPRLSSPDYIISVQDVLDMGARLLGDLHHSLLVLRSGEHHATFFLLSEDAWLEYSVEVAINSIEEIRTYGVLADCFFVSPVTWSGGGTIRGFALCRAKSPGLHTAVLKILCSTGIVRPLHLVADALLFSTKHITLQAHDKDYDVCSEDDPACEYYLHLGTTFPKCSLSAAVTVVNHSPVSYNYYWSVRPWGVCSCWKLSNDSRESEDRGDDLCPGALAAKLKETPQENNRVSGDEDSLAVRVEQVRGRLAPRQDVVLTVRVPDVAEALGVRRAVLMLVLTDIPKESFPADYDPMIINVSVVEEEAIPGISPRLTREVCEVVCSEMEVWWEVVPIRFVLDPPLILVPYSRRVKSVIVTLRATQLCGVTNVQALWEMKTPAPAPLQLFTGQPSFTTVTLPLKQLSNEFPETSYIRLISEKAEWSASSSLQSWSSQRALALRQARVWLGVLPPGAPVAATLIASNDTYQHIYWSATCHRWYRERAVAKACVGRPPCAVCFSRACTCSSLTPYRGSLNCTQQISIKYQVNAPDTDGCVATLVQVRRTAKDGCQWSGSGGSCGSSGSGGLAVSSGSQLRASLIAYRVLAPRVTVAVLSCGEDESQECKCCARGDSEGPGGPVRGAALPRAALVVGDRRRICLQVTNVSPIPTRVQWEQAIEQEDDLKVTFIPTEFDLGSYSRVAVVVLLEARRVSARRLAVRRARVLHAPRPLYLLLDVSVSGVEVVAEFPTGGGERTATSVSVKMMQQDLEWRMSTEEPTKEPLHPFQLFAEDDRRRARQKVNICECRYEMRYVAPTKAPRPPRGGSDDHLPVEIVEEPPPLTRTCPCSGRARPALPDHGEPYCLQFTNVPVRTVRSRSVYLRNACGLDARWRGAVRRFPREHARTVTEDPWAGDVRAPGVLVALRPARGSLRARGVAEVSVAVYADCWGLYYDQILFQVEDLEPLVIDVWVEVVGAPLHLAPALWMSKSDADRVIRVSNTSRADLAVFAYVLRDNEFPQESLPFRLYLRLLDVPPRTCPCLEALHSNGTIEEESCGSGFYSEEMDTGVELFLAPDCGLQDDTFYQVAPSAFSMEPRGRASLQVRLLPSRAPAPACSVLLRCVPVNGRGAAWCRPSPPAQCVSLREAARGARLSCTCSEIRVALCALDMPVSDVVRIRKRFNLRNVGEGSLDTTAITELPWRLDVSRNICSAHCKEVTGTYAVRAEIHLPPRSSAEMVAVLTLKTAEVWPRAGEVYPPRTITSTALSFYDQEDVMLFTIPLILDLDTPVLSVRPELLDLGSASDGGAAKSHFTVSHSSSSAVIELVTSWSGDDNFRIWPSSLSLRPGVRECVHVQYTARWSRGGVSAGWARVRCAGAGGAWCGAVVQVRAAAARSRSRGLHSIPHSE